MPDRHRHEGEHRMTATDTPCTSCGHEPSTDDDYDPRVPL